MRSRVARRALGMALVCAAAAIASGTPWAAWAQTAAKGYLGLGIDVDGSGPFWNMTLRTVRVSGVKPGSPAAQAGLLEGDRILELDGHPVAGARANDLKPHLERVVGQPVRLLIQRGDAAPQAITLIAGPRPP